MQSRDLRFKFSYAGSGTGLVRHLFFGFLKFCGGEIVIVIISKIQGEALLPVFVLLAKTLLGQPVFQPFTTPAQ